MWWVICHIVLVECTCVAMVLFMWVFSVTKTLHFLKIEFSYFVLESGVWSWEFTAKNINHFFRMTQPLFLFHVPEQKDKTVISIWWRYNKKTVSTLVSELSEKCLCQTEVNNDKMLFEAKERHNDLTIIETLKTENFSHTHKQPINWISESQFEGT